MWEGNINKTLLALKNKPLCVVTHHVIVSVGAEVFSDLYDEERGMIQKLSS